MKCLVIHHNDLDGQCAAAIVARRAKLRGDDVLFSPASYAERIDWALFDDFAKDTDECWIVDYSVAPEVMCKIRGIVGSGLFWIDHHQTAIARLTDFARVAGMRDDKTAACLLTWWYCFPLESRDVPRAVALIADRDTWRFEFGDETRHFCEALKYEHTQPWATMWDFWLNPESSVSEYLANGALLMRTNKRRLWRMLKSMGREEVLGGHLRVLTVNYPGCGEIGEAGREMGYERVHCYFDKPADGVVVVKHSIYSSCGDAAAIATSFGGGGHAGAAGWIEKK
jgi:uncharacterized protein